MKILTAFLTIIALVFLSFNLMSFDKEIATKKEREIYQIRVFRMKSADQVNLVDNYLKNAYLPALHRLAITRIGVFKNVGIDTATEKTMYVLIPMRSLEQLNSIEDGLVKDQVYNNDGAAYLNIDYNTPAYIRTETIVLRAFKDMPKSEAPKLNGVLAERIYELRSYESATEKLYKQKVKMFNEGGEIKLFKRLEFNAVFYGEVLAGSHMPNLMYMTSFDNRTSRDEHWKKFGADPEWKTLSALPEYQHTVSKIDIVFLHPVEYSEI